MLYATGMGWDCYRHWETLSVQILSFLMPTIASFLMHGYQLKPVHCAIFRYAGSIPVIERSTFDRVFAGLPVLLVDSYEELSEEFLNRKYEEMTCHPEKFDWQKLTLTYWKNMIAEVIQTADNRVVQQNHPIPTQHYSTGNCFLPRTDWLGTTGLDCAGTLL